MEMWAMAAVLVVLATGALAYIWWREGPKQNAPDLADQFERALRTATAIVAAAEQLWATGRLPKDERLAYVMEELERLYPGLDEGQLRSTVEAAVYWLKLQQTLHLADALGEDEDEDEDDGEGLDF